ncbi:MAG: NADH:flavin oxidoreductase [Planctomycetales bacterium]|nr:NADH:flavin oxidoreductase [Planctomycetales bacterium]
MANTNYTKIAQLKSVQAFRDYVRDLQLTIPVDTEVISADEGSPLAQEMMLGRQRVANRWCIHPMEGWDANPDGTPSELTLRRWQRFGLSGAKLIWGGEAAAIRPDGRANPRQTLATEHNRDGLRRLLHALTSAHHESFGDTEGLVVGLQLTHSGRFCRPNSHQLEPRIAYHHPLLDEKFGIGPTDMSVVWTDEQLEELIEDYVRAARLAAETGYQFVDVKACHGYLLHEFLSARSRPGRFGGDFEGRTRLLTTIISRVRQELPELEVVVRLSVFDCVPYATSMAVGRPMPYEELLPYSFGFGVSSEDPLQFDLSEPLRLLSRLVELGVAAVNVSGGSPYYNPHIQRPAIFPPSDGYLPPEDPLIGVARQIDVARACRTAVGAIPFVGSGYSYLQDYLPHVAQAVVREGWIDSVGLGRMVLSYPDMPADTLAGRPLARKKICRTFSDCTTAPRHGLVSGCYPLDSFYKDRPESPELIQIKQQIRQK